MTEPTIEWRDGLSEFLPAPKKAQAIIRHVIGEHQHEHDYAFGIDYGCSCGYLERDVNGIGTDRHADHLTAEIMQALTEEDTP